MGTSSWNNWLFSSEPCSCLQPSHNAVITLSGGTSWWKRQRTSQIFRGSFDGPQLLAAPWTGEKKTCPMEGNDGNMSENGDDIPTETIFWILKGYTKLQHIVRHEGWLNKLCYNYRHGSKSVFGPWWLHMTPNLMMFSIECSFHDTWSMQPCICHSQGQTIKHTADWCRLR